MIVPIELIPAVALPGVVTLYWICAIFGGGLLVLSTVLGGHGHDVGDVDVDLDVDLDADFDFDAGAPLDVDLSLDADAAGDVDFSADTDIDPGLDADIDTGIDGDFAAEPSAEVHELGHADHEGAMDLASWFSIRFVIYFMAAFGLVGTVLTHLSDHTDLVVLAWAMGSGLVVGQGVHQLFRKLRKTSGNSALTRKDFLGKTGRVTIAIKANRKGEIMLSVGRGERYVPATARHDNGSFESGERVAVIGYVGGVAEVISQKEFEFLNDREEGESS
ncbi:MAG: hypothetical protein ACE5E5_12495 [Phycisphaerae bacterium]